MNSFSSLDFIDKTIQKTKNSELSWKLLPNNFDLKPLPENAASPTTKYGSVMTRNFLADYSYVAQFKTGFLTLLVYQQPLGLFSVPPEGCLLSLRMQDEKSRYSVEISNSSCDPADSTQLLRLYNLIDKESSSVSILIDDFLNS